MLPPRSSRSCLHAGSAAQRCPPAPAAPSSLRLRLRLLARFPVALRGLRTGEFSPPRAKNTQLTWE
eukprot:3859440-Pleurochrysis_carterae.AAC.1